MVRWRRQQRRHEENKNPCLLQLCRKHACIAIVETFAHQLSSPAELITGQTHTDGGSTDDDASRDAWMDGTANARDAGFGSCG